jgi:hypothetical protein
MLYIAFLIVAGLVLVGLLSADFEMLGMRGHPNVARILATVCVIIAAYAHSWIPLIIVVAVTTMLLLVRKELQERAQRKHQSI